VSSQARASLQEEVVVERVLATVDGVPVLLSDVRVVERVRGIGRDEALRATIDERLMFQEASRLA
jgi:hypothetical protein